MDLLSRLSERAGMTSCHLSVQGSSSGRLCSLLGLVGGGGRDRPDSVLSEARQRKVAGRAEALCQQAQRAPLRHFTCEREQLNSCHRQPLGSAPDLAERTPSDSQTTSLKFRRATSRPSPSLTHTDTQKISPNSYPQTYTAKLSLHRPLCSHTY